MIKSHLSEHFVGHTVFSPMTKTATPTTSDVLLSLQMLAKRLPNFQVEAWNFDVANADSLIKTESKTIGRVKVISIEVWQVQLVGMISNYQFVDCVDFSENW